MEEVQMSDGNHTEFAKQVLRAVAHLYKHHPRMGTLSSDIVLKELDPATSGKEQVEAACGTIMWLHRNCIVIGDVEAGSRPYLKDAQLTSYAYAKLRQKDSSVPDSTLGQAVVRAASGSNAREEEVVAELLIRRLS